MNRTQGNVARYNISANDQTHLIQMHGTLAEGNHIYNNVFYVDYGTVGIDFYMGSEEVDDEAKQQLGAHFVNNIFYATGQGRFRTVYTYGSAMERQYLEQVTLFPPSPGMIMRHNWYFGSWKNGLPDDPEAMTGDPMLVAPGTGGIGLDLLGGYRLREGSPCVGTGVVMTNHGACDFFGNPLKETVTSSGVFEPTDVPTGSI